MELILLFSSSLIFCIDSFSMKSFLKDVSHLLKASDETGCNHINQYEIMYLIASVNVWKVPQNIVNVNAYVTHADAFRCSHSCVFCQENCPEKLGRVQPLHGHFVLTLPSSACITISRWRAVCCTQRSTFTISRENRGVLTVYEINEMFKTSVNKLFTSQCSRCRSDHGDCINTTFVLKPVEITSGCKAPRPTYNREDIVDVTYCY